MKKPVTFLWKYLPWHLLLVVASLSILAVYASITMKDLYLSRIIAELTTRSTLILPLIDSHLPQKNYDRVQAVCDSLGKKVPGRITVVLADGTVIGDSDEDPADMENHSRRPEIVDAVRHGTGNSVRFSSTVKMSMLYVAVAAETGGEGPLIIRNSLPLTPLTSTLHRLYFRFAAALIIVMCGAALIAFMISKRISRPISQLIEGSRKFSRGELTHRVHISDPLELLQLGRAMNTMAAELHTLIDTMNKQQQEMKSVLTGMSEALVATDMEGKIIRFNNAASGLFHTDAEKSLGRSLEEIIRNMDLLRFVDSIRSDSRRKEHEAIVQFSGDRFLQARGSVLPDTAGRPHSILLVLNDITRIKRLENIRKEFVANVSHELKTPITAISAAVETLINGAVNDKHNGQRFLIIIRKHTARLHNLVEDLLQISRLEGTDRSVTKSLTTQHLAPVIKEAVSACRPFAEEKQITLEVIIPADISAPVHAPTLEQALINLIDNAVKYSPAGTKVTVSTEISDQRIRIAIIDQGEGIPPEHQERIFERFYRVDKSRSREQGGTGLGLAIAKHAVMVHNGEIRVESAPGKGSRFTVSLPAAP